MIASLLLLLSGVAHAQDTSEGGFDARGRQVAVSDGDLKDPLVTWRPEAQRQGSFGFAGVFEYAEKPLVQYQNDQGDILGPDVLLDNLFGLNLGGTYGVHERVAVTASLPLWFTSASLEGAQGVGLGDMRLAVPVGIVMPDEATGGFGLSVVPLADLPTGSTAQFLGNRTVSGGGVLAAGISGARWSVDGNLGARLTPSVEVSNITGGPQLLASLNAGVLLDDHHALRGEYVQRSALDPSPVSNTQSPSEVLLSARGRYDGGLNWLGGGAVGVSPGAGASVFRLYAGIGYTLGKEGDPVIPSSLFVEIVDQDGNPLPQATLVVDGTEQDTERGRYEADGFTPATEVALKATLEGYRPDDAELALAEGENTVRLALKGLPAMLQVKVVDTESKPLDARVALTDPAGDAEGEPQRTGPEGMTDLVLQPGTWTVLAEAQGYGVKRVEVPLDRGSQETVELVLEAAKVNVTKDKVVILEKVNFAFDEATVLSESMPLLEEVADTLLAHPELRRVEVAGHTDAQGGDQYNLELSQRRVETVRQHLIDRGVQPERLVAKGYGESKLLDTSGTEAAHAANRRVEFTILERAEE